MITYQFPVFTLTHNPDTGETYTRYEGGYWSGCGLVEGDHVHAPKLGITPQTHRLQHELAHHLVGIWYYGQASSPVIYRDAHLMPQPERDSMLEEWYTTSFQYFLCDKNYEWGALLDLSKKIDLYHLKTYARWLMQAAEMNVTEIRI